MQLAGGIIGAAIGAAFPAVGAGLGWSLGVTLAGLIDRPKGQVNASPKMDLKVPGTADGRPLPWIIGRMRVAVDWAWHTDRRKHTTRTSSGGKGGQPKVVSEETTYDMDALFLLAVGEGVGAIECYKAGELIYRVDVGASFGTIQASENSEHWDRLTIYPGGPDQLPDPDYEAAVGVGHAPAYRGRLTAFAKGLKLGTSGQVPQLEFVAVMDGTSDATFEVTDGWAASELWNVDRSVALDAPRNALWLNEGSTNPNSAGGQGRIGWYDFEAETFNEGPIEAPYVSVRSNREPTYHSHVVPEWGVYLYQAQTIDGLVLTTVYVDLATREIIGDTQSIVGPGAPFGFGSFVSCPDPAHNRVLISSDAGNDLYLYNADDRGLPTTLIGSASFGSMWIVCDNNGDFWINSEATSITRLDGTTLELDTFTLPDGLQTAGSHNSMCFPYDRNRHCIYFFDRANISTAHKYVYRFNCADQTVEQVNSVAFDVSTGPGGGLAYDPDSDLLSVSMPQDAHVLDPDTGEILHTLDVNATGSNFGAGGQFALTSTSLFGPANADGSGFAEWRFNSITPECVPVEEAQERICLRSGLEASQVNVTPLAAITREVCCLPWTQISAARQPSETLMGAYYYEAVMSGSKIKFVPRGGSVLATVPYADLGARLVSGPSDAATDDPLPLRLVSDFESPAFGHVNYINLASNFTDGSEPTDRLVTSSAVTVQPLDLALGLFPAEAKGVIDTAYRDRASALIRARIWLLRSEYPTLEPTDCLTVTGPDGSEYRVRVVQTVDRFPVVGCDIVLDDPNVLSDQGITTTDYESQTTVALPPTTTLRLADLPLLRSEDDFLGPYAAAKGDSERWHGATVLDSNDNVSFSILESIDETAIFGSCATALNDYSGSRIVDFRSRVRVNVGDAELTSSTRAAVMASQAVNAFAIGNDATGYECGQFINAELISASPNIYELTNLIRGSRGTNWRMTGHTVGERFFLLRGDGMRKLRLESAQLAATRYYKGVTVGRAESTAMSQAFVCNGVAQRPFSPSKVRVIREASGDTHIIITRRTRAGTRYTGSLGVSVPLGEASEAYTIRVYADGTYTTIVDTLSVIGTNELDYTAAAQTLAGLTPGDTLYMDVHQLSAVVGLGYALRRAA